MLQECPHCYVTVIPSPEGICPACREGFNDPNGVNPDLTLGSIEPSDDVPNCCMVCGQRTRNQRDMTFKVGTGPIANFIAQAANLISLLGLGIGFLKGGESFNNRRKIKIKVPVCEQCFESPRLEPHDVDFENFRVSFVVHRNFHKAIEKVREEAEERRLKRLFG